MKENPSFSTTGAKRSITNGKNFKTKRLCRLTLYAITLSAAARLRLRQERRYGQHDASGPGNPSSDFPPGDGRRRLSPTEMTDASAVIWKAGDKLSAWIDGDVRTPTSN